MGGDLPEALALRGLGDFFGTKQAGANLIRDRQLLEAAKRGAAFVVAGPAAELSKGEIARDRAFLELL